MKRKSPDDPERGELDMKRTDRSLYSHASRQASHDGSEQGTSPAYSTATPNYEKPQTPLKKKKHNFTGVSKLAKYKLESKLGEGTFGEVHKGTNKETGEIVALKRILMHHEKEGIPITAVREIKILKQLNHPNVVPLTDMAIFRKKDESGRREQTEVYMVFPYMDHDLAGLLENPSANLSLSHIKTYFQQLLKGTAYLHHNKILHRDIKAANLLIDNKGILQIADFGLARGIEEDGRDYTACVVTRWYRPPELLLGERKYTSAIDMWGVGCILGEILKGRPILQGSDDMDQLKRIFSLVGSPTEETMPGWRDLPDANKVHFDHYKGRMQIDFDECDPLAVDLLSKILVLDPKKRLTAMDALDHDFFFTEPAPARPEDLPRYSASHEFDNRQRYANAKAAQAHR